jgi:hypothetical protein
MLSSLNWTCIFMGIKNNIVSTKIMKSKSNFSEVNDYVKVRLEGSAVEQTSGHRLDNTCTHELTTVLETYRAVISQSV